MSSSQTYTGITIGVVEDFYNKALESGFVLQGAAPTSFDGPVSATLVYKKAVVFDVKYTSPVLTVTIVSKAFPYDLVPDDAIFAQITGYVTQATKGELKPNMSVWSSFRHENEKRWGGFARPYFKKRPKHNPDGTFRFHLAEVSYTPLQVARMYSFPAGDGSGKTIGLVELGGGYQPAVLDQFQPGLSARVSPLSVDGGANSPGQEADGEVYLDIEIPGAILSKVKLVVGFAPNTEQGFVDAVIALTAVCDYVSVSWGAREDDWTPQGLAALNQAIADAAAKGVTVTVAQGDNAYTDGGQGPGVDFPGSSPYALSCGGTNSHVTPHLTETVWFNEADQSGTGGGVSTQFALPSYQQYLTIEDTSGKIYSQKFRIVPDVSGDADPATGYEILMPGEGGNVGVEVVGGTSAVAPLWAALLAAIGFEGQIHPKIYVHESNGAFNPVTGNNGKWVSVPGQMSGATGLGTPNGEKVKALLAS